MGNLIPIGYTYLNQHYKLLMPRLGLEVYQNERAEQEQKVMYGAIRRKILPGRLKTPEGPFENMIAAIKHQGIRLHIFAAMFGKFEKSDIEAFTSFILLSPNGKNHRVLWHLYEWLTGKQLDIPDLKNGNYEDLFNSDYYYTVEKGWRDRRTRINNNAIGTRDYCPMVRKVPKVLECAETDIYSTAYAKVQELGKVLPAGAVGRSIRYLYTKETRSSNEIERERLDKKKMQRFLNAIKNAGLFELSKEKLLDVQNQIVTGPARADDYRSFDVYVGNTIHRFGEVDEDVCYVAPSHELVASMMTGLLETNDKLMKDAKVPALIHAGIISFGEVYIHPFEDGNGRIHRYLIHDVMRQREPGHEFIIPISAAILKNTQRYDEVLETVSRPVMAMLDYELDEERRAIIKNDINYMYRYPDFTEHIVFVYEMMQVAIFEDLIGEMLVLLVFDSVKSKINVLADIPNHKADTLTSIVISGGGRVSTKKKKFFAEYLNDQEIAHVEKATADCLAMVKTKFSVDVESLFNGGDGKVEMGLSDVGRD